MSGRMRKHILEAQIAESTDTDDNDGTLPPIAGTLTLEACKCKHLQKFLPHVLDLTCAVIPESGEGHWIMANPVHALHMASQLEPDGATVVLPNQQSHGEPALYGDEQLRTKAIITNGISPAVELIDQGEEEGHEYATRNIVPPHLPPSSFSTSPGMMSPQQQQKTGTRVTSSSIPSVQVFSTNTHLMPHQQHPTPPMNAASFPRRPALPSGILPPSSAHSMMPPTYSATMQPQNPHFMPPPPNAAGVQPMMNKAFQTSSGPRSRSTVSGDAGMALAPTPPPPQPTRTLNTAPRTGTTRSNNSASKFLLDEERFEELRRKEQALMMQRHVGPTRRKLTSTQASKKKKKPKTVHDTLPLLPNGLFVKTVYKLNSLPKWQEDARIARATVEEWMERYRLNRYSYWQERQQEQICGEVRECLKCSNGYSCGATGDELMQCLDCSLIGCRPQSLLEESNQHMMHHMIRTGHSFAVTCGERADVFCFKCGDIIYHEIFDQERERIDISKRLPWMGWHDGPVQRSFDAMQFLNTTENGVIWRGMIASYPQLVPQELVRASRLSMQRLLVNRGELSSPSSLAWGSQALGFAVYQNENESSRLSAIQAPVGMYNLGNTCFMTCILQCLIHCVPLQQHFLQHVGHHHKSCELVRSAYTKNDAKSSDKSTSAKSANDEFDKANICLACEMDKLFLQYFGSSIGQDVARAVCQAPHPLSRYETPTQGSNFKAKSGGLDGADTTCRQGEPLVTTKLLAAAWKSGGMDHLAGYEQGDAHEFLQAFLDIVGKHEGEYRKVLRFMQRLALPSFVPAETSAVTSQDADIIKRLFEGTLRSVLICDECGCKRKMPETFLNVSLPLSKHFHEKNVAGTRGSSKAKMSLERCLEHFTAPESLADPVDCPQCMKKTRTKKQHTFAKVPKVFCLHLKRFDAAKNRKIDDFVSFPARGLDMGRFYPHWSEIGIGESNTVNDNDTSPQVLYDLFATANHTGTLHQGHYVANVKVGSDWYHCNDQMVSRYDEKDVLHSEGAYVLFYIRR